MPRVNIPNIGGINFPDDMSQADIERTIQTNLPKWQSQTFPTPEQTQAEAFATTGQQPPPALGLAGLLPQAAPVLPPLAPSTPSLADIQVNIPKELQDFAPTQAPSAVGPPRPQEVVSTGALIGAAPSPERAALQQARMGGAGRSFQVAPSRSALGEIPSILAGGAADFAEIALRAGQLGAERLGQASLVPEEFLTPGIRPEPAAQQNLLAEALQQGVRRVEALKEETPLLQESKETIAGGLRQPVVRGAKSAVTSALSVLPGLAGGAVGMATSGGLLFGAAEYKQAEDDIAAFNKKAPPQEQIPPDVAEKVKLIRGGSEAGFEFLSDLIGGKLLGFDRLVPGAKETVLRTALTPTVRETLLKLGGVVGAETGSEMATAAAQAYANRTAGLSDQDPAQAAVEAVGPSVVAALLLGGAGQVATSRMRGNVRRALEDSEQPRENRLSAVETVAQGIDDETLAADFKLAAGAAVARGEAIPLDLTVGEIAEAPQREQAAAEQRQAAVDQEAAETQEARTGLLDVLQRQQIQGEAARQAGLRQAEQEIVPVQGVLPPGVAPARGPGGGRDFPGEALGKLPESTAYPTIRGEPIPPPGFEPADQERVQQARAAGEAKLRARQETQRAQETEEGKGAAFATGLFPPPLVEPVGEQLKGEPLVASQRKVRRGVQQQEKTRDIQLEREEISRVTALRTKYPSLEAATDAALNMMEENPGEGREILGDVDLAGSDPRYRRLFVEPKEARPQEQPPPQPPLPEEQIPEPAPLEVAPPPPVPQEPETPVPPPQQAEPVTPPLAEAPIQEAAPVAAEEEPPPPAEVPEEARPTIEMRNGERIPYIEIDGQKIIKNGDQYTAVYNAGDRENPYYTAETTTVAATPEGVLEKIEQQRRVSEAVKNAPPAERAWNRNPEQALASLSDEQLKQVGDTLGVKQGKKTHNGFIEEIWDRYGQGAKTAYLKATAPIQEEVTPPPAPPVEEQPPPQQTAPPGLLETARGVATGRFPLSNKERAAMRTQLQAQETPSIRDLGDRALARAFLTRFEEAPAAPAAQLPPPALPGAEETRPFPVPTAPPLPEEPVQEEIVPPTVAAPPQEAAPVAEPTPEVPPETPAAPAPPLPPPAEPAVQAELPPPPSASQQLATWVMDRINTQGPFSNQNLFTQADKAFGGTQAEGKYTPKDAYDAMEMGVNQFIARASNRYPLMESVSKAQESITDLKRIGIQLPTQTKRTQEQDEFQQFSTPPHYAYTAAWAANIDPDDVVLEPSAGIGGLAIFAKNAGATTVVNELSPRRAALLRQMGFDQVFTENAEQLNNILPADVKPTVVLMNPPFSSTAGRIPGQRKTSNAEAHIEQALARLEPGGRLVAIVGKGMAEDTPTFRNWWKKIKGEHNVRANIGISGKEYTKYGTSFGNQLVVIDKTGPTPQAGTVTGAVDRIEDALPLLEGIRNDRRRNAGGRTIEPAPVEPAREEAPPGVGATTGPAAPPLVPSPPVDGGGTEGAPPALSRPPGELGAVPEQPGGERSGGVGVAGGEPGGAEILPPGLTEPAEPGGGRELPPAPPERGVSGPVPGSVEPPIPSAPPQEMSESVFEKYGPQTTVTGAQPHPEMLVETAAMSAVRLPVLTYAPQIDDIVNSGKISDAQLEAVSYAGMAHEQLLPNGERRGMFIGDGCVAAGTRIFNPLTGEHTPIELLMKRGRSHVVLSLTKEGLQPQIAMCPFRKSTAKLYRVVLDDGRQITVTDEHRFLTPEGWRTLKDGLTIGDFLAVAGTAPSQDRVGDLHAHEGNELNCLYTIRDYPGYYHPFSLYPCDGQFLADQDSDRESFPLPVGALARTPLSWHRDGRSFSPSHTHQDQSTGLPSRSNFSPEETHAPVSSTSLAAACAFQQKQWIPVDVQPSLQWLHDPQSMCEGSFHQWPLASRLSDFSCAIAPRDVVSAVLWLEGLHYTASLTPLLTTQHNRQQQSLALSLLGNSQIVFSQYHYRGWNRICTVQFVREDAYYDMYVPGPENYVAEGFINHNTGVGKGREISAIILDNWNQGRKKAIWISKNDKLLNDAKRDVGDTGGDVNTLFSLGKIKLGTDVQQKEGVLFTTYDTLASKSAAVRREKKGEQVEAGALRDSRLDQLVRWAGEDFDGVIALDESHVISNLLSEEGERGKTEASQRALAAAEMQRRLPKARVVYVSATGATDVKNLAYASRLGLWGEETPFTNVQDFVNEIGSGGVAAMELVAQNMKAAGSYMARSLDYSPVSYRRADLSLTPQQRAMYNKISGFWQIVLNNMNQALELTEAKGNARGNRIGQFWNNHQRFFNQLVTSMQMPGLFQDIRRQLDAGNAVVVQLTSTNESLLNRKEAAMQEGDSVEDLDLTPRQMIAEYLERAFPTQQYEEYEDENGNTQSRPVLDSQGKPVQNADAVRLREQLLDQIGGLPVPEGALDLLVNEFGGEAVAEITGRKRRRVKGELEDLGTQHAQADARAFMDDRKQILVFSEAGGTGQSYHAARTATNQRKRIHYLVQPGWKADSAVQGLGRTHRTNQASAPEYVLVSTDVPGQKRFLSTIARRLDQLGALTRGQRQAGSQGLFGEKDNLENIYASNAVEQFFIDLHGGRVEDLAFEDTTKQMGLKLLDKDGNYIRGKVSIRQFLNRLLSLDLPTQEKVMEEFSRRHGANVERAIEEGTLDTGLETLRGKSIRVVSEQSMYTDPRTKAVTNLVALAVEKVREKTPWGRAQNLATQKGGMGFYRHPKSNRISVVYRTSDRTDPISGAVVPRYMSEGVVSRLAIEQTGLDLLEKLTEKNAEQAWNQAYQETPDTITVQQHLVVGSLLPIWKRLGGHPRIVRAQTDSGQRLIGRMIPPANVEFVVGNFGLTQSGPQVTPVEAVDRVLNDNFSLRLSNSWTVKRSRVSGEERIEITGPAGNDFSAIEKAGGILERINYKTRAFVPIGENAGSVFEKILRSTASEIVETTPPPGFELQQARQTLPPGLAIPRRGQQGAVAIDLFVLPKLIEKARAILAKKAPLTTTDRQSMTQALGDQAPPQRLSPLAFVKMFLKRALALLKEQRGSISNEPVPPPLPQVAAPPQPAEPPDVRQKYAGNLNLDRIETLDDVNEMFTMSAKDFGGFMRQRRGVRTQQETQEAADELSNFDVEEILRLPKGFAANPEQAKRARDILTASGENAWMWAQQARDTQDPETKAKALRAYTVAVVLQQKVAGLTAEAGRTLNSFKIPARGTLGRAQRLDRIMKVLAEKGEISDEILKRLGSIDIFSPAAVAMFIRDMAKAPFKDKVFEAWINMLLSGPQTHIVNTVSNALTLSSRLPEQAMAAGIDMLRAQFTGTPQERFAGEVKAELFGLTEGLVLGAKSALKAWQTETPQLGTTTKIDATDPLRPLAIPGKIGRAVRIPGRALLASDELFKAANYSMELHSLAYRQAMQEGFEGELVPERVAEILHDPAEELREKAVSEALYRTYQQPLGPAARKLSELRRHFGIRYIVPFFTTPLNIAKFGLERTPLNLFRVLYLAKNGQLQGGQVSDELAKAVLGSLLGATAVYLTLQGTITGGGPDDEKERRKLWATGWQPYAAKVGDTFYGIGRLEPLAITFGLAADATEIALQGGAMEWEDLASSLSKAFMRNVGNKTFLQGVSNLIEAVSYPERYGDRWLQQMAGSLIPTGVAQVARAVDPTQRQPKTLTQVVQSRIPGLTQQVPALTDIWGQPVRRPGNPPERLLSPVRRSIQSRDKATLEVVRLGVAPGSARRQLGNVALTDEEYQEYKTEAGARAHEAASLFVARPEYDALTDDEQTARLTKVIQKAYRETQKDITPGVKLRAEVMEAPPSRPAVLPPFLEAE